VFWVFAKAFLLCVVILAVAVPFVALFMNWREKRESGPEQSTLRMHTLKATGKVVIVVIVAYDLVLLFGVTAARVVLLVGGAFFLLLIRFVFTKVARSFADKPKLELPEAVHQRIDALARDHDVTVIAIHAVESVTKQSDRKKLEKRGKDPEFMAAWVPVGRRRGHLILGRRYLEDTDLAEAVTAHEIGHALVATPTNTLIRTALTGTVLLGTLLWSAGRSFPAMLAAAVVASLVRDAIRAALSRRAETKADMFAIERVGAPALLRVMENLQEGGFGGDLPGLADNIFASHPHIPKRLARIRQAGSL
jgi:Zn-dependent protease with chaperone function